MKFKKGQIVQIRKDIEEMQLNCAGALPLGTLETTKREIEGPPSIS